MKRIELVEARRVARLICAMAFASIASNAYGASIERMNWLAGCWKGGSGERVVEKSNGWRRAPD